MDIEQLHILSFFLIGIFLISLFIEKNFREDYSISTILFFSVLSHLFFDMVTLAGIPLFYLFIKILVYFLQILKWEFREYSSRRNYSFYVLLSNFLYAGFICEWFWSTINNFNDVKHQIKEYKKSPNVLTIDYDYNIYQTITKERNVYKLQKRNILSQDKVLS
jgi:inner membrane protein